MTSDELSVGETADGQWTFIAQIESIAEYQNWETFSYHFSFHYLKNIFHSQFTFLPFHPFVEAPSQIEQLSIWSWMLKGKGWNVHKKWSSFEIMMLSFFLLLFHSQSLNISHIYRYQNVVSLIIDLPSFSSQLCMARIWTVSMKTNNIDIKWHFNLFTQDKRRNSSLGWTRMKMNKGMWTNRSKQSERSHVDDPRLAFFNLSEASTQDGEGGISSCHNTQI